MVLASAFHFRQVKGVEYTRPVIVSYTLKLGRFDVVMVTITKVGQRAGKKGKTMKSIKSLVALLCADAFLGSVTFAQAEKTCCEKAKDAGKTCEHKCCV